TTPSEISIKEYYDPATHLLVERDVKSGEVPSTLTYGDYKEVNGILIPYKETITQQIEFTFIKDEVKINSGLTDADFK
ncbi:MAG: hypothetical protein KGM98_12485, partial [Bacteroidota bacterium]|nr:hypothetical protein [Bacteroidota bacterium]